MSDRYRIIEVSGSGCANCISMMNEVDQLAKQFHLEKEFWQEGRNMDLQEAYGVDRIPCVLLLKNEELLGKVYGYQPYEILELWIEDKLGQG